MSDRDHDPSPGAPATPDRYHRQMLLPGIGEDGQRRLGESRVLLVGCGALGCVIADSLTRAGVGHLRLVDRDVVEWTNLQRQPLFTETDAREGRAKAAAARETLARANSQITIEAAVEDFAPRNAERLADGCDLILDGTDNFETRYLINDLAVASGRPWIYGGAVGTSGMVYVVLPHTPDGDTAAERADLAGPCLRCIFPDPAPPGSAPTCDTAGVLGPVAAITAQLQSAEALKLLTGNLDAVSRSMLFVEGWQTSVRAMDVANAWQAETCPCCGQHRFDYLAGKVTSTADALCGRDAVHLTTTATDRLDLPALAERLAAHGPVRCSEHLLRLDLPDNLQLTLFADGRSIIHGTSDPATARSLYSRYIGA